MIRTRTELTAAIRKARTMAASLKQPGAGFGSPGERELCATLLEDLADVITRKESVTDA